MFATSKDSDSTDAIWSSESSTAGGASSSASATNWLFPDHWKPSEYRVVGTERQKIRGDSVFSHVGGESAETDLAQMPSRIAKADTVRDVMCNKFFAVQFMQSLVVCFACNLGFTYGA